MRRTTTRMDRELSARMSATLLEAGRQHAKYDKVQSQLVEAQRDLVAERAASDRLRAELDAERVSRRRANMDARSSTQKLRKEMVLLEESVNARLGCASKELRRLSRLVTRLQASPREAHRYVNGLVGSVRALEAVLLDGQYSSGVDSVGRGRQSSARVKRKPLRNRRTAQSRTMAPQRGKVIAGTTASLALNTNRKTRRKKKKKRRKTAKKSSESGGLLKVAFMLLAPPQLRQLRSWCPS